MIKFLLVLAGLMSIQTSFGQGYDTALGLRVGSGAGLSLVQRVSKHHSFELVAANRFGTDAYTLTLLGRRHVALGLKRINFFVGAGVHKGWNYKEEGESGNPFGISGQGGVEITLGRTNISFDYLPQIHLSGRVVPVSFGSAVGLRYVIKQRKNEIRIRYPWETREEAKDRQQARDKRKKQKAKEKRRGERKTLRERLGLD